MCKTSVSESWTPFKLSSRRNKKLFGRPRTARIRSTDTSDGASKWRERTLQKIFGTEVEAACIIAR